MRSPLRRMSEPRAEGQKFDGDPSATVAGPPTLSVADATVEETEGATLDSVLALSKAVSGTCGWPGGFTTAAGWNRRCFRAGCSRPPAATASAASTATTITAL